MFHTSIFLSHQPLLPYHPNFPTIIQFLFPVGAASTLKAAASSITPPSEEVSLPSPLSPKNLFKTLNCNKINTSNLHLCTVYTNLPQLQDTFICNVASSAPQSMLTILPGNHTMMATYTTTRIQVPLPFTGSSPTICLFFPSMYLKFLCKTIPSSKAGKLQKL